MKEKLPGFKNEDDERKFWATADATVYVDWTSGMRRKLAHLKPSQRRYRYGFRSPLPKIRSFAVSRSAEGL
jgi:hypothetical protein